MADHLIAVITVAAKPFQFHHRSISPHHHHTNAGNKLKFHLQFHQFTCKLITINHVLIFSFSFAGLEYHNQARASLLLPASFSAMEPKRQRRRFDAVDPSSMLPVLAVEPDLSSAGDATSLLKAVPSCCPH